MTKKVKVKALAEELGLDSKELLKTLKELDIPAKTAASSLEEETAELVREFFQENESPASKEIEEETSEPEPEPEQVEEVKAPKEKAISGPVITSQEISVKDFAELIKVKSSEIIKELMKKGIMANINQIIEAETAKEIANKLEINVSVKLKNEEGQQIKDIKAIQQAGSSHRPPVVTIMGHVDHGKTKLLDAIRTSKVAEGEAGGITQHIGAYQVEVKNKKVTFLDTPGHEAFTHLRARGAKVTDIAILVVAADDGVKPQTIEAIDHAKAADVPIIVAVNKMDKPGANPDRVKQQLSDHGLMPEEWGGKTITVATSAIEKTGIDDLLEMILLVAEVQELKADTKAAATGVIIESRLDKGRGPVASVLVQNGTLKVGDIFVCGPTSGKVRAMFNEHGKRYDEAKPSSPVEVLGFVDVPQSGDSLQVMNSEKEARDLAEKTKQAQTKQTRSNVLSLQDFSQHIKEGDQKDLNIVIKADVQGSLDAIRQSLNNLTIGNINLRIIHDGVGAITESDVMLAKASDGIVLGFHVTLTGKAQAIASDEGVEVRNYDIIYKLIDDIKMAMEGMLEPEYEEVILGHAEVRQLFKYSKVGVIAGCYVTDGQMIRGVKMRIFRDKKQIFEGKLENLKRFKDDAKTVEQNYECGISVTGFTDFKQGDIVEAYEVREKARDKK